MDMDTIVLFENIVPREVLTDVCHMKTEHDTVTILVLLNCRPNISIISTTLYRTVYNLMTNYDTTNNNYRYDSNQTYDTVVLPELLVIRYWYTGVRALIFSVEHRSILKGSAGEEYFYVHLWLHQFSRNSPETLARGANPNRAPSAQAIMILLPRQYRTVQYGIVPVRVPVRVQYI